MIGIEGEFEQTSTEKRQWEGIRRIYLTSQGIPKATRRQKNDMEEIIPHKPQKKPTIANNFIWDFHSPEQ